MFNVLKIWLAFFTLAFFVSCSEQNKHLNPTVLHGSTMGTTYQVKFFSNPAVTPDLEELQAKLQNQVDNLLKDINQKMSTYIPHSELSLLNKHKSTEPYTISRDTAFVIQKSIELAKMTDGALDITVGPLVNLWGFGPNAQPKQIPSDTLITQTRKSIGIDKIALSNLTITKQHPDLYIDLSAIAKGFAVDQIAELLETQLITDYMVEIGGEMRLNGTKPNFKPWRIAIEKPVSTQRSVQQVIEPGDGALATSGDYRNYFEQDGVRYSHTIDPKTAKPIRHKLASVSVVHQSCAMADGLATALNVMGPDKAFEFAKKHRLAAYLVIKSDTGFTVKYTEYFKPFIK